MVNSSQFLLMSFAYIATPNSRKSLQSFKIAVAMFSEEGKCHLVRIHSLIRICGLVHVHNMYLQLWGSGLVLALNCEDL